MSATAPPGRIGVPRSRDNDYTRDAAARRREFLQERTGASLEHVSSSAREANEFCSWLDERFDEIRAAAEATTRSGRLIDIERYSAGRMLYTRFNYTTGDAAGQNLTGKATQANLGGFMSGVNNNGAHDLFGRNRP